MNETVKCRKVGRKCPVTRRHIPVGRKRHTHKCENLLHSTEANIGGGPLAEVWLHLLLTSALGGDGWSSSRPGRFIY